VVPTVDEYEPTGQPVHEVDASTVLYFPAAQSTQADANVAPVAVPYFDGMQSLQEVCLNSFWYLPAAQFMQLVAPVEALHLPSGQLVQIESEVPAVPETARNVPSGHDVHEAEPEALYLPAEQVRHVFTLVASTTLEYNPALHEAHSLKALPS